MKVLCIFTIINIVIDAHTIETGYLYCNSLSRTDYYETTLRIPADQWETTPVIITQYLARQDDVFLTKASAVRDVTVNRIQINVSMLEFQYQDGLRPIMEMMNYIAVDQGVTEQEDGTIIQAGLGTLTDIIATINFSMAFETAPVVIVGLVETIEPIIIRLSNVETSGFEVLGQREEALLDAIEPTTFAWIAFEQSPQSQIINAQTLNIDSNGDIVSFGIDNGQYLFTQLQTINGSNPAWSTVLGRSGFDIRNERSALVVTEEQSSDEEIRHFFESVGYVVLPHINSAFDTDNNTIIESILSIGNSLSNEDSLPVFFSRTFTDPIVIGQAYQSPVLLPGVTQLSSTGLQVHFLEWFRNDGVHNMVDVLSFLVVERGTHVFTRADGSFTDGLVQADSFTLRSGSTSDILFTVPFADDDVIVLTQVVGSTRPLVLGVFQVDEEGFSAVLQLDPNDEDRSEAQVLVHYVALKANDGGEDDDVGFVTGRSSGSRSVLVDYGETAVQMFARTTSLRNSSAVSAVVDVFNYSGHGAVVDVSNVADNSEGEAESIAVVGIRTQSLLNLVPFVISDDIDIVPGDSPDGGGDDAGGDVGGDADGGTQQGTTDENTQAMEESFFQSPAGVSVVAGVGVVTFVVVAALIRREKRDHDFGRLDANVYTS